MFKARGTRVIIGDGGHGIQPGQAVTIDDVPHMVVDAPELELEPDLDDGELGAALGIAAPAAMPGLPGNLGDIARAAITGDLAAIQEMRRIGDDVPAHMQVAFAEMVEGLLGDE